MAANPDIYPTNQNNKSIWRDANALTAENRNKWESTYNIKRSVHGVSVLPFLGLGTIISLESGVEADKKVYRIIISHILECTCLDF